MADRADCILAVKGELHRTDVDRFWALIGDLADAGWDEEDPLTYIANGGGNFCFRKVKFGEMPSDVEALLTELGLSWAWHWDAGDGFAEGVSFRNAATSATGDHHARDSEIVLSIDDATNPDTLALAIEWSAFWCQCGEITIVENESKGGETNTEELD